MFGLGMPELIVLSFVVIPVIFFFLPKGKKNVKSSKCTNCGATLDNSAKFCNTCGSADVVSQTTMRPHAGSIFLKLILGAGFLLLLYSGFQLTGGLKKAQSGGTDHLSNLDQEAVELTKDVFFKAVVNCGDFIYIKTDWNLHGDRRYKKLKANQWKITVSSSQLTEAQRMNGVEWLGAVTFDISGPSQEADGLHEYGARDRSLGSGPWQDSGFRDTVGVEKIVGKWNIKTAEPPRPFTCDEALSPTGNW